MPYRLAILAGVSLGLVAQDRPILIRDVRIFDGTARIEANSVLVSGGTIAKVGKDLKAPKNAEIVDGTGSTLLPGLIDAHTHAFGPALSQALVFGVTTELDMFSNPASVKAAKAAANPLEADIRSAGTLATAPGGHGTEYGFSIPTLTKPEEAQAFVDARIAEGSDYLKIIIDDGKPYGLAFPTLDEPTVKALVIAAHRRGLKAVAHVGSLADAKLALRAGVDGLVHTFEDQAPDAEIIRLAAAAHAFVVPTLSVEASVAGVAPGWELAKDPRIAPWLGNQQQTQLEGAFPTRKTAAIQYAHAEATVRAFKAAGIPILAGTDAPNPGTTHGASLHGELSRLVQAGLTPTEALRAATSIPAFHFKLSDRGRIAEGLRADLLLVKGDPTADIRATREILGIWKQGRALDRKAAWKAIGGGPQPAHPTGSFSVIGAFEGTTTAPAGLGWLPSTDQFAGGKSQVTLDHAPEGAAGTHGSLLLKGTVAEGLPYAWSGTMWFPGKGAFSPVDVSAKNRLTFWAKGDGKTYRVVAYSAKGGMVPTSKTFATAAEWKAYDFPLAEFEGVDPKALTGIGFVAGPAPGAFEFQVDEITLK